MLAIVQSLEARQKGISIFLLSRPNSSFLTTTAVLEVAASWHGRGDVMAPRAVGLRKAIQRPDVSLQISCQSSCANGQVNATKSDSLFLDRSKKIRLNDEIQS